MRVKDGADVNGIHFLLLYAAAVYDFLRLRHGWGPGTITSGRDDDEHRTAASLHRVGLALDLRTSDLSSDQAAQLEDELRGYLGAMFYVEHQASSEGRHLHVQLSRAQVTASIEAQASA